MSAWRPIKSAPSNRKIIVHYLNELGKDRTVFAIYAERGSIESIEESDEAEEIDGQDFLPAGWWEIVESPFADFCYVPLGAEPTDWMPMPPSPEKQT